MILLSPVVAGEEAGARYYTVEQNGSGDFSTIQGAIDRIPKDFDGLFVIYIGEGRYREKLFLERSNILLCGAGREKTIIEFAELRKNWLKKNPNDYGSAVINIQEHISDIIVRSVTVINDYGKLYGDNDHAFAIRGFNGTTRIILDDCAVISHGGDTVSLWNTEDGMYYHTNCHFEGWVDYVCPRGYCLVENSTFYGFNLTASIWHDGSKKEDHKFVIKNSTFDGVKNFPLGRFHRDAQFFLIDCTFSENMADKEVFFAPSNPPRTLQWGTDRIYFSNCKAKGKELKWIADNLELSKEKPAAGDITPEWVFKNLWNPVQVLSDAKKLQAELRN